ncbi:unnamed protein product [Linum tenue]|uniref:Transcription repressor n=1 Tax=Linum tenue TaxID=586396 RepID=A0AAV0KCL8_9ROSI|nr:unnamed protein product [Linum tenue]
MGKRFQLPKFSRVIPSSFHYCRSKNLDDTCPSSHPAPIPSFHRLVSSSSATAAHPLPPPPDHPSSSKPRDSSSSSSIKRHVSSAITSIGCGCASKSTASAPPHPGRRHVLRWEEEDKWHVAVASNHVILPPASKKAASKRRVKKKKKKKKTTRIRISTSSADTGGLFSSEGSSSPRLKPISETVLFGGGTRRKDDRRGARRRRRRKAAAAAEVGSPARLSRFSQWVMPCKVEGKVKESYAVVKRSEDPREDFKRSMAEMIREKEMFEEKDLEQLLRCFLSLNSKDHHPVIVQAFSEIWEDLI